MKNFVTVIAVLTITLFATNANAFCWSTNFMQYEVVSYDDVDSETGQKIKRCADSGNKDAQYIWAHFAYVYATRAARDGNHYNAQRYFYPVAVYYYHEAAKQGHVKAQSKLKYASKDMEESRKSLFSSE